MERLTSLTFVASLALAGWGLLGGDVEAAELGCQPN